MVEFNETSPRDVWQFKAGVFSTDTREIIREVPLQIILNGQKIATVVHSAAHEEELAVGFLRSEGLIAAKEDIAGIETSGNGQIVRISTRTPIALDPSGPRTMASSGARSMAEFPDAPEAAASTRSHAMLTPEIVFRLMDEFLEKSTLHDSTGGTHAAALATSDGVMIVREDIGRHNAIDMLGGNALLEGLDCSDKIIVRTGRVSSEIVHKVRRLGIPIVISISVPTTLAIALADQAGITLVGGVRNRRLTVYSHEERFSGLE